MDYEAQNAMHIASITVEEKCESQHKWIQHCQALTYSKEIDNIRSNSKTRLPLVRQLRLFIDGNGSLRCGGGSTTHHYLNKPSSLTFFHKSIHSLSSSSMKLTPNKCTPVLLQQSHTTPKVLDRLNTSRSYSDDVLQGSKQTAPFSVTRVDYTGPLYVRSNNGESKSYICLFTCAVTRALNLEVVPDLTENSFLQAFRRFASRKSLPSRMVSDNASTFTAGANELEQFQSPSVKEAFTRRGVDWLFIPKRAP